VKERVLLECLSEKINRELLNSANIEIESIYKLKQETLLYLCHLACMTTSYA
jgi:hypothetical protein